MTDDQFPMVCAFGILAAVLFGEPWTGASRVQYRFRTAHIA